MATQWTAGLTDNTVLPAATLNRIGAAWETWTPTVTQSVNVTVTQTIPAYYGQVQKIVVASIYLTVTGTGTTNNNIVVSLPITARQSLQIVGQGFIYDNSASSLYAVTAIATSTTAMNFFYTNASGSAFGVSPNIGLAVNDQIRLQLMYEAA
jgi:hypothetical protein